MTSNTYDKDLLLVTVSKIAKETGIQAARIWAVVMNESKGKFSWGDGKIPILLERHIIYRLVKERQGKEEADRIAAKYPDICNATPGGYGKYNEQYKRLAKAIRVVGEDIAHNGTSFGGMQIMGFNHSDTGYDTAKEMSDAFHESVDNQIRGFITFLQNYRNGVCFKSLKSGDWERFAYYYNGKYHAKNRYVPKLMQEEAEYYEFTGESE